MPPHLSTLLPPSPASAARSAGEYADASLLTDVSLPSAMIRNTPDSERGSAETITAQSGRGRVGMRVTVQTSMRTTAQAPRMTPYRSVVFASLLGNSEVSEALVVTEWDACEAAKSSSRCGGRETSRGDGIDG